MYSGNLHNIFRLGKSSMFFILASEIRCEYSGSVIYALERLSLERIVISIVWWFAGRYCTCRARATGWY